MTTSSNGERISPSGNSRKSGDQINYQCCPICGSGMWKVYMNPDTGAWLCFKCGAKGKADVGRTKDNVFSKFQQQPKLEWPECVLPEYKPLGRTARKYLRDRGISNPEQFGIVAVPPSRVLIPYSGPDGRIIYWTTRCFVPDGQPKYMTAMGKHPLYVLPRWQRYDQQVAVVEGVFDAMLYHLATGNPVVAIGGKSLPRYLEKDLQYIAKGGTIVMLDGDAMKDSVRLARRIGGMVRIMPPGEDPASYYKRQLEEES